MKTTIITRNIYCLNKYIDSNLEDKYSINSEDVIDKFNKTQNSLSVSF